MDSGTVDPGWDGELMDNVFAFAKKRTPCARRPVTVMLVSQPNIVQGSVTGYKDVFNVSERTLMSAVSRQPVSTAIEADQSLRQTCRVSSR